jgi:preprotein translocase subunit SecA
MLRTIDALWMNHLDTMDSLRTSIGLRSYGQRDPLVEYKKESFRLFNQLLAEIRKQVVYTILKVRAELAPQPTPMQAANVKLSAPAKTATEGLRTDEVVAAEEKVVNADGVDFKNVGRNDACPCKSGKKFKKCHGK